MSLARKKGFLFKVRCHFVAHQFHAVAITAISLVLVLSACGTMTRHSIFGQLAIPHGRKATPAVLIVVLNRIYWDAPEQSFETAFAKDSQSLVKFAAIHLTEPQLVEFETLLLKYSSEFEPS